jgi:hypothetical protein
MYFCELKMFFKEMVRGSDFRNENIFLCLSVKFKIYVTSSAFEQLFKVKPILCTLFPTALFYIMLVTFSC